MSKEGKTAMQELQPMKEEPLDEHLLQILEQNQICEKKEKHSIDEENEKGLFF